MTSKKLYAAGAAILTTALLLVSVASAQSVYTAPNGTQYNIPAGYTAYSNGVYYDSAAGIYYDPATGQSGAVAPQSPAPVVNGSYTIPAGFNTSLYGTYYNPTTGVYYDPATGFTSTTMPLGPNGGVSTVVTTPTLPDTGAGGNAATNFAILAGAAAIALGGAYTLSKNSKKVA